MFDRSRRSRVIQGLRWFPVLLSLAVLAPACAPLGAQSPATASPAQKKDAIRRTLLGQYDLPEMPSYEARLYLIEYAGGVSAPLHHHPVEGVGYVVSGSFESAFDGDAPVIVREGQSFKDRPSAAHVLFRNADPVKPLRFVIAYVVRRGEPVVLMP
ncbi:MAG: cupin domain-containing protein [Polyangiaceae bacterium]